MTMAAPGYRSFIGQALCAACWRKLGFDPRAGPMRVKIPKQSQRRERGGGAAWSRRRAIRKLRKQLADAAAAYLGGR